MKRFNISFSFSKEHVFLMAIVRSVLDVKIKAFSLHDKLDETESYLKVSAVNSKKAFELVIRNWNSGPNLLNKISEKRRNSEKTHPQNFFFYSSGSSNEIQTSATIITDLRMDRANFRNIPRRTKTVERAMDTMRRSSSGRNRIS